MGTALKLQKQIGSWLSHALKVFMVHIKTKIFTISMLSTLVKAVLNWWLIWQVFKKILGETKCFWSAMKSMLYKIWPIKNLKF